MWTIPTSFGGYNGGGNCKNYNNGQGNGAPGGGGTDVRTNLTDTHSRVVVAGGGGGGNSFATGGAGGG